MNLFRSVSLPDKQSVDKGVQARKHALTVQHAQFQMDWYFCLIKMNTHEHLHAILFALFFFLHFVTQQNFDDYIWHRKQ